MRIVKEWWLKWWVLLYVILIGGKDILLIVRRSSRVPTTTITTSTTTTPITATPTIATTTISILFLSVNTHHRPSKHDEEEEEILQEEGEMDVKFVKQVSIWEEGCFSYHGGGKRGGNICLLSEIIRKIDEWDTDFLVVLDPNKVKYLSSELIEHLRRQIQCPVLYYTEDSGIFIFPKQLKSHLCSVWKEGEFKLEKLAPISQLIPQPPPSPPPPRKRKLVDREFRYHLGKDYCYLNMKWAYPPVIWPPSPSSFNNKAATRRAAAAVVYYLVPTSRGEKFKAILRELEKKNWTLLPPEVDIVIALPPRQPYWKQKEWNLILEMTARLQKKDKRVQLKVPPTLQASDLAPGFLKMTLKEWNCCGWAELTKLGVWNMVEYDILVVLDHDITILEPIDELFSSSMLEYDFLATTDPVCILNGGFLWLRPNKDTFLDMKRLLGGPLYDIRMGWNQTGQLLPLLPLYDRHFKVDSSFTRIHNNKLPYAMAQETNQGFLFWYFFILKQGRESKRASVAFLDPCVYNYNIWRNDHGVVCRAAIERYHPKKVVTKLHHKGKIISI
jgi:hypothetical protein